MRGKFALAGLLLIAAVTGASAQTMEELYESGVKARQEQRFDDAVDLLRRALALKADNTDVLVQLGFAELGRGNLEPARTAFTKTLELAPNYSDAKFGLAQVEFRSGNLDKAQTLAEAVAQERPKDKDIAALLQSIHAARQEAKAPEKGKTREPKRPRAKRPDPVATLMERGRSLRASGQLADAERTYREALRLAPHNTDILVALGLVEASQQKFDAAARSFDAALEIRPNLLDARLGKVRLAMWQGDIPLARTLADEALVDAPRNSEALVLGARISLLEGDHDRAERSFREALTVNPQNAEALVGLGDVYRLRNDDEASRAAYQQALALEPGSQEIVERLAQPPPKKWRLDVGGEVSGLSGGRGSWTDNSVGIAYQITPRTTISARTRLATRSGETDVQIEGRIDQAFSSLFSAYASAAATPSSDFLARYSLGAGASWQIAKDEVGSLFLNIDARHDKYAGVSVTTVSPWVQAYLFDDRLGLSARWVHSFDDEDTRADGYVLRADIVVSPTFKVFAGYGDAPEIDDGSLVPTRTVFGGASWDITEDLTLRANMAHERRPAFDRETFGVGITKRF